MLADIAQQHAELAVATLVNVCKDEAASPAARVSAASEILNRGFGRAPQHLDIEHKLSLGEEFEQLICELNAGSTAEVIEGETEKEKSY